MNEASFSQIIREISESLTLNKALKFGKVYPRNKQFYQLQKLNRKFFKIRPFCQRSHTDNFKSERLSSFGASAKRFTHFQSLLCLKFALMQEETWRCFHYYRSKASIKVRTSGSVENSVFSHAIKTFDTLKMNERT